MADEPDEEGVDSPGGGERTQDASADATESMDTGSTDDESEANSVSGGLDVTISEDFEDESEGTDDDDASPEDGGSEGSNSQTSVETESADSEDVTGGESGADSDSDSEDDPESNDGSGSAKSEETAEGDEMADGGSDDEAESDHDDSEPEAEDEAGEAEDEPRREAKTDGEGVVDDVPEREREDPSYPDPDDDIGGLEAPPDDEEMPLADHIEEMILRLAVVLLFGAAATAIGLLWASEAIEFIWLEVFPASADEVPPPHVYHPLELWLTRIKVAALLGIMVALPAFVYQCYLFMRPGLYPNERKYYLAAVPTSVVLAGVGMLFSFFVVLPILFEYFTFYAEGSADIAYALGETFNLIITLTGFLAIVFQIPLFMMLAIMMGVTTRRWLAEKRLYFWAAFFGLSFMFTVDPTMMAPIIVALVMILLFEGTLLILKWVGTE